MPEGRDSRPPWWPVWLVVTVLAISNVMTNRVLADWAYAPWGLGLSIVLIAMAAVDGCRPEHLGLGRRQLGSGLRWGGAIVALIVTGYFVALALPQTRGFFDDARVADTSGWGAVLQVGVRIPLGTVLAEEIAFRGVLLGMLMRRVSIRDAVLWSSALFGMWHLLPSLGIEETNPVLADLFGTGIGPIIAVVAALVGTAVAGVVWCWLRIRSGSLVAPMLVHLGTNSVGFAVSWIYLANR